RVGHPSRSKRECRGRGPLTVAVGCSHYAPGGRVGRATLLYPKEPPRGGSRHGARSPLLPGRGLRCLLGRGSLWRLRGNVVLSRSCFRLTLAGLRAFTL